MSHKAECPECGRENNDVHELLPYEGDYRCDHCGKEFFLRVQPSISVETHAKQGGQKA